MAQKEQTLFSKIFWYVVKFGIAFGVAAYLICSRGSQLLACLRTFNYLYLIPAMFFYGLHMVICAWRWRKLAAILNVRLSFGEALSLTMQGYFFSLVIPGGAIGGDVVKMGVISKRSPSGTKMEGAFTVLMDRIVGMIALFVLALLLLVPATPLLLKVALPGAATNRMLIWLIALLCLAGLGASCAIFFHRLLEKIPPVAMLMRWGDRLSHGMVGRLTASTDVYSTSWKKITVLVIVSIFGVHLMTVVPMFFLLGGASVSVSCLTAVTALTIGNIVGLIPLFPGGLGGRDLAVIAILCAGGIVSADAEAAQLLYSGILIFFNLLGGLFFAFDRGRSPNPEVHRE